MAFKAELRRSYDETANLIIYESVMGTYGNVVRKPIYNMGFRTGWNSKTKKFEEVRLELYISILSNNKQAMLNYRSEDELIRNLSKLVIDNGKEISVKEV